MFGARYCNIMRADFCQGETTFIIITPRPRADGAENTNVNAARRVRVYIYIPIYVLFVRDSRTSPTSRRRPFTVNHQSSRDQSSFFPRAQSLDIRRGICYTQITNFTPTGRLLFARRPKHTRATLFSAVARPLRASEFRICLPCPAPRADYGATDATPSDGRPVQTRTNHTRRPDPKANTSESIGSLSFYSRSTESGFCVACVLCSRKKSSRTLYGFEFFFISHDNGIGVRVTQYFKTFYYLIRL